MRTSWSATAGLKSFERYTVVMRTDWEAESKSKVMECDTNRAGITNNNIAKIKLFIIMALLMTGDVERNSTQYKI